MNGMVTYEQTLRVIGQALEAARVETFNVERLGDEYLVRGVAGATCPENEESTNQRSVWNMLGAKTKALVAGLSRQSVEVRYASQDIEKLEQEGRARRGTSQSIADLYSPSQILRAAGAHLDRKLARLVELSRQDGTVTLQYDTAAGPKHEELPLSYLYDVAVSMYRHRSDRAQSTDAS